MALKVRIFSFIPIATVTLMLCADRPLAAAKSHETLISNPPIYSTDFNTQIEKFLLTNGLPDKNKISKLKAEIEQIENSLKQLALNIKIEDIEKAKDENDREKIQQKILKKLKSEDLMVGCSEIKRRLKELPDAPTNEVQRLSAEILTLVDALQQEKQRPKSLQTAENILSMLSEWSISKKLDPKKADKEASNLHNPESGKPLSVTEIAQYLSEGKDVSAFDPTPNGPFWRKPAQPISNIDVIKNFVDGNDALHKGLPVILRDRIGDNATVEFRRLAMSQTKPKMQVYLLDKDGKRQLDEKGEEIIVRLKFGGELNSDTPVNALMSLLGYNTDITKNVKNIRINIGNTPYEEIRKGWRIYFNYQVSQIVTDIEDLLVNNSASAVAECKCLIFKETLVEQREEDIVRMNGFAYDKGLPKTMREARGMGLFNMWISNQDIKDSDNNKVFLRRISDDKHEMFMGVHDAGHAFGLIIAEQPDKFPSHLVRFVDKVFDRIVFNYFNLHFTSLRTLISYSDAKWMARQIGQITRKQIADAMSLGRFEHKGYEQLYTEKLIQRRNELVKAFDLIKEFPHLDRGDEKANLKITTEDKSVIKGEVVNDEFWQKLLSPVWNSIADAAKSFGAMGLCGLDGIRVYTGLEVVPEIFFWGCRSVKKNPNAKSGDDLFIVYDSFQYGFRLGAGLFARAEYSLVNKTTLVWTMKNETDAWSAKRLGLFSPFFIHKQIADNNLPTDEYGKPRYVLLREISHGPSVRLETTPTLIAPIGFEASLFWEFPNILRKTDPNNVITKKTQLDNYNGNIKVISEQTSGLKTDAQIYSRVLTSLEWLQYDRRDSTSIVVTRHLDPEKLVTARGQEIFMQMIQKNQFENVESLVSHRDYSKWEISKRRGRLNLLFREWISEKKTEIIEVKENITVDKNDTIATEINGRRRYQVAWSFPPPFSDFNENHVVTVRGFLGALNKEGIEAVKKEGLGVLKGQTKELTFTEPVLKVEYSVRDGDTHIKEIQDEDGYYSLASGLAPFTPHCIADRVNFNSFFNGHTIGVTELQGDIEYYPKAVKRILEVGAKPEIFWTQLAADLGVSLEYLMKVKHELYKDQAPTAKPYKPFGIRSAVFRGNRMMYTLKLAAAEQEPAKQLKLLIEAMYVAQAKKGHTFSYQVLGTLHKAIRYTELQDEGMMIRITIDYPKNKENRMPLGEAHPCAVGEKVKFRSLNEVFAPYSVIQRFHEEEAVSDAVRD